MSQYFALNPIGFLVAVALVTLGIASFGETARADTSVLPSAGSQLRVIHPRDDKAFGEQVTLTANGKALIRRLRGFRTGKWQATTCGAQNTACVQIESQLGDTTLTYSVYAGGLLVAHPSSGPEWSWSYELGW
ncbi:MAG: hypothetical protein AAFQ15_05300 [Pseudomonadota bacterium]